MDDVYIINYTIKIDLQNYIMTYNSILIKLIFKVLDLKFFK